MEILLLFLFTAGPQNRTVEMVMLRAAKELKIDLSDLKIDKEDLEFYGSGRFRTKLFDYLMYDPVNLASKTNVLVRNILNNADSLWAIAYFPWARIDEGVRRGFIDRPDKVILDSLKIIANHRKLLTNLLLNHFGVDSVNLEALPDTVVSGLLLLLSEIKNSFEWIRTATPSITDSAIDSIIKGLVEEGEDGLANKQLEELIEATDFKSLAAGAMDLSYVLQTFIETMKNIKINKPINIETKYGKIAIGTAINNKYNKSNYLLLIDFGGDDEYTNCAVTNKDNPISIVIDFEGNDTYRGYIGPGTGICGYGVVLDLKGDDSYFAEKLGIGTGIFGEGIILDFEGNDTYSVDIYGEGAGLFGAGVLSDLSGNDLYKGFQGCQGFGFVKGAGILIDKEGNDTYIARDDTVKYPSPQTEEHNVSLAQGTGFGIRADFTDGHSLAGGVGILIDGKGNDEYSCGVFGQGCGYWFGSGFLIDYGGDDEYKGVWYVQGAGAHFALGVLLDSLGNDKYQATKNMAQGAGHDFTLGYLLDYEGDDYHEVPNLSLGGGNANGMGLFIDLMGDDEYITHGGITLGKASIDGRGSIRDYIRCLGMFIDGAGNDKYNEPFARNKKIWNQKPPLEPSLPTEWCFGIDF